MKANRLEAQEEPRGLRPTAPPPVVYCSGCNREAAVTKSVFGSGWRWDCWTCRTRTWDPKVPMTYRVSRETLLARERAHEAIDRLWESQPGMSEVEVTRLLARSKVYHMLAEALGLPEEQVHLSVATEEVANRIAAAAPGIKEKLDQRTPKEIRADFKERGREIRDTLLRDSR